ncbi:unnamed protein product [Vitrella brassicaformis CCMP3155]|uniref:Major facilitator superfamily (MFS) profile domain-containing protein n=1 Tax=Vitrella brassicaformis (strain CCMP3155) TaxID=1169540 RepID=A0A0G4GER9_VITBC|nr:unnamed protein product [Vitrella brassicaformis CCMP3155]|eukprot:CEM27842.1 unnamed protein product [Vitrella brassicaformis CCMP3155]
MKDIHYGLVIVVWFGCFTDMMYQTVIVTVSPRTLSLPPVLHSLIFIARPIIAIGFAPIGGIIIDRVGWKKMLVVPFALLAMGGLCYLIKDSLASYIVARVLQGFASSILYPAGFGALARTHDKSNRATAVGIALTGDVGAIVGPAAGGFLYDAAGSKCVWGVMLVLACGSLAAVVFIAATGRFPTEVGSNAQQLAHDLPDLVVPLTEEDKPKRQGYAVFANVHFITAMLCVTLPWAAASALQALLPLYWRDAYGLSASATGALFMPQFIAKITCGPTTGFLIDRFLLRPMMFCLVASAWCALCTIVMGFSLASSSLSTFQVTVLTLFGVGLGSAETSAFAFASSWLHDEGIEDHGKAFALEEQTFNGGLMLGPLVASPLVELLHNDYALSFELMGVLLIPITFMCLYSIRTYKPPKQPAPHEHLPQSVQLDHQQQQQPQEPSKPIQRTLSHPIDMEARGDDSTESPALRLTRRMTMPIRLTAPPSVEVHRAARLAAIASCSPAARLQVQMMEDESHLVDQHGVTYASGG